MKSNIILLISWSIFFIISCNTSSNNIAEIHKSDSLIKEIKMDYIHSYDTSYHSQYANEPDSLFQLITHYKTNKTAEADFYKQLSESNQGKCFIQKMKEIYNYSKLSNQLKLPSGARIIEKKTISTKQKSDRMLILWIINPYVFLESENSYTCPEYATGKAYFEGKTFVSLISTPNHKIINTLQIENNFTTIDTIDNKIIHETSAAEIIPISARKRTRSNSAMSVKYFTINSTDSSDGKVQILHLEDFNQDENLMNLPCLKILDVLLHHPPYMDIVFCKTKSFII